MGWGERFAAFPLAQDGCFFGREGKQKEKRGCKCIHLHKSLCTSLLFARKSVGWHRAQPEEMRVQSDKAENDAECCNEYLHFDSFSASSRFRRPARCSKNCELSAKSSPLLTENSPFSHVSSGEVGVSRHVGGKSRLATGKNAGWKKLARRKKNSIFAEVCSACDISFESPRCSPCVAQSFSSRRHTAGDSAGTFGVYRALLRRRQPFILFFFPYSNRFMLEIRNLHASVEGKEILRGIDLTIRDGEVHVLMGPNGSGKSTLSNVLVGNPKYEVTEGEVIFNGKNLLELEPEDRSHEGIFMSFQAPIEIPGVSMTNFMRAALNAKRKYFGQDPLPAADFLKLLREKRKLVGLDAHFMSRGVNEGFSGGERKRNEIFQMAVLEPTFSILDETDSGLDVDALRIVAEGFNQLRTPQTSAMVITHYQRMLDYLHPDFVHVLVNGRVVKNGTAELGYEIEQRGFDWIKDELAQ